MRAAYCFRPGLGISHWSSALHYHGHTSLVTTLKWPRGQLHAITCVRLHEHLRAIVRGYSSTIISVWRSTWGRVRAKGVLERIQCSFFVDHESGSSSLRPAYVRASPSVTFGLTRKHLSLVNFIISRSESD